jgi:hypothetical protein
MTLRKWAAGIAAFILLALCAAPALATTYYLNGSHPSTGNEASHERYLDGRDNLAGTSSALAWGRLSKANASVKSGDVVMIERCVNANYQGNIDPACQDTVSAVPTDPWVTYIGDINHPEWVPIYRSGGQSITKRRVSVKGVSFKENLDLRAAWDSLNYCNFDGAHLSFQRSRYSFVGNSHATVGTFGSDVEVADSAGCPGFPDGTYAVGNEFNGVHFTQLGWRNEGGTGNNLAIAFSDSSRFLFCTFDMKPGQDIGTSIMFKLGHATAMSFRGCRWNYGPMRSDIGTVLMTMRDSMLNTKFDCDTMIFAPVAHGGTGVDGPNRMQFRFSSDGNLVSGRPLSVKGTTIDSCYFHLWDNPIMFEGDAGMDSVTITRNVFINENSGGFYPYGSVKNNNVIDHNTFIGKVDGLSPNWNGNGYDVGSPLLDWTMADSLTGTLTVTNNIFYGISNTPGQPNVVPVDGYEMAAVLYDMDKIDPSYWSEGGTFDPGYQDGNANRGPHFNHLTSDHNLYSYYALKAGAVDTIGMRSIGFSVPNRNYWYHFVWPGRHPTFRSTSTIAASTTITPGVYRDSVYVPAHTDSIYVAMDTTGYMKFTLPASYYTVRRAVVSQQSGAVSAAVTTTPGAFIKHPYWEHFCPACDDSSTYGSPMFADSAFAPWFDATLHHGSLAVGLGTNGSDAGAIAYTSPPSLGILPRYLWFWDGTGSAVDSSYISFNNDGDHDDLNISGLLATPNGEDGCGTFAFSTDTLSVPAGGTRTVKVTYTPVGSGFGSGGHGGNIVLLEASVTGASDDPSHPTFTVPVSINRRQD